MISYLHFIFVVACMHTAQSQTTLLAATPNAINIQDARVALVVNQPYKGPRVITQTEPWEAYAVFAYNSVVQAGPQDFRMYYDCIEGVNKTLANRRICMAQSTDGLTWTKPNFGVYNRSGSTNNNILLDDSGVSVFIDGNPTASPDEKWKMACSTSVYGSADGIKWHKLSNTTPVHAEDDTKPTAYYDPGLGKYVIYVRRDVGGRKIGRCVTDDFTVWEKESPSGCPIVFATDSKDPPELDVYTNAWTPYPNISNPSVHLFFPSFYHHFGTNPYGHGNDGLLDIRLLVAGDLMDNLTYPSANNARSPFVPLGISTCGSTANSPDVKDGWCSDNAALTSTSFDTSAMYMASGFVESADGHEIFFYSSGQPFTHGGYQNDSWVNNTGIRVLRMRKDGFVSVNAPYYFDTNLSNLPTFTTKEIKIPDNCPKPKVIPGSSSTGCTYEFPNEQCPSSMPTATCKTDSDCLEHGALPTCHGVKVGCKSGVCSTGKTGGVMCRGNASTTQGGAELHVNIETSVAGFALFEILHNGSVVPGLHATAANAIKGSSLNAAASWGSDGSTSLSSLAGETVTIQGIMTDAKLFSLSLVCVDPPQ
eukprot:m.176182 g.176182  ORF g.176182 m.176182 type:complete len:592 (-) comp15438_c0_seq14:899-2674(-)